MARTALDRPAALHLSGDQALAWRLHQQHLHQRAPRAALLDVAARLCGLRAQVLSSGELTAWARMDGLEPGDVTRRALWDERSLVKTWAMRGTLHLLPATDYPLWQAAMSPENRQSRGSWPRYYGVTPEQVDILQDAISAALDGPSLTRVELAEAVSRTTSSAELGEHVKGNWGGMLKPAAFQGRLIFAPGSGQNVRFTPPDRWLGAWEPLEPGAALVDGARRYFAGYGPATVDDLARWWGGGAAHARRLLAALGDEVLPVDVNGTRAWLLAAHARDAAGAALFGTVNLLPTFDQYVAAGPRSTPEVLPTAHTPRVYRQAGWLSPVLLVDGRIAGVWRHERKGSRVLLSVEPFSPLPAWVRPMAEQEAERLAAFLGGTLDLTWAD